MKIRCSNPLSRSLALALLLTAFLASLVLPATASAQEPTLITVSAPSQPVQPGEQVTVNIIVAPGTAIAGIQFNLRFDPSLFAVDGLSQGNLLTQDGAPAIFNTGCIDNEQGIITGAFGAITSPGQGVSGEGTFATITMTAKEYARDCNLVLSNVVVGDPNGNPVPASVNAASDTAVFRWWVLTLIVGAALAIIVATTTGLLFRRHLLLRSRAN